MGGSGIDGWKVRCLELVKRLYKDVQSLPLVGFLCSDSLESLRQCLQAASRDRQLFLSPARGGLIQGYECVEF